MDIKIGVLNQSDVEELRNIVKKVHPEADLTDIIWVKNVPEEKMSELRSEILVTGKGLLIL